MQPEILSGPPGIPGVDVRRHRLSKPLRQFQAQGWAEQAGGRWRLTPKGFLVSNQLIGDLLERQDESSLDQLLPRARARFSGSHDGPFVDSV